MIIELDLIQNFFLAGLLVTFFVACGLYIKSAFSKKSKARAGEDKELTRDYKNIIKTANKHAKTILVHTSSAAGELLSGTRKTNEHLEEHFDRLLQDIAASNIHNIKETTKNFDGDYQKSLQNIQVEMREAALSLIQNAQKEYNEKLEEFTRELLEESSATRSLVDKKTADLLTLAEAEITEYKKEKMAKADEEVSQLVQKVYRDVLRLSIPESVHQDLILKSLEEAKRDGLFKL